MSEQTPVTALSADEEAEVRDRYQRASSGAVWREDMLRLLATLDRARAQPDLAALRAARDEVYGLLSIDSRYDRRDGAAVMKADVLAVFDRLLSDATEPVAGGSGHHDHDWVVTVEYDEGRTENVARCIVCGAFRPVPESPE